MKYLIISLLLLNNYLSFSQENTSITSILNTKHLYVKTVKTNSLKINQFYLATDFANPYLLNPQKIDSIPIEVITDIQLVYTTYKESDNFLQNRLNQQRLIQLHKIRPNWLTNTTINWEIIAQTNGTTAEYCKTMFHGFIVTYRSKPTLESRQKEINFISLFIDSNSVKNLNKDSILKSFTLGKVRYDKIDGYVRDTIWSHKKMSDFIIPEMLDHSVISILDRHPEWRKMLVCVDITGSMSPYDAQVLKWLIDHYKDERMEHFTFFNDGDSKYSYQKTIGETEGIYHAKKEIGFSQIATLMKQAMEMGSGGGEGEENDIEALLSGINQCQNCNDIILIADNYENMRDLYLAKKLNHPIKIIVCSAKNAINKQYLYLARITKGSIHTQNEDLYNLDLLVNGEEFEFNGRRYLFKNNRFVVKAKRASQ